MANLRTLLESPWLLRTRRNHGLEHATIHVLSQKNSQRSFAGRSDAGGFWLLGELNTEEVQAAVAEALRRLRAGQRWLAIHPNCGTNLMTAGAVTGLVSALAMRGASQRRAWLDRLPLAVLFSTLALMAARPLGTRIQQRVTTSSEPGDLEVLDIQRSKRGNLTIHRVVTHST
ncbi:MAG: DUF6391 domain-containing protein [Anaerolineales bacterium]